MFDTGRDNAIVQRGIDEALACRDMLEPAPAKPSLLHHLLARVGAAIRGLRPRREPKQQRSAATPAPVTMR